MAALPQRVLTLEDQIAEVLDRLGAMEVMLAKLHKQNLAIIGMLTR